MQAQEPLRLPKNCHNNDNDDDNNNDNKSDNDHNNNDNNYNLNEYRQSKQIRENQERDQPVLEWHTD